MMVAGGTDQQPAGRWLARNYAGVVYQLLEKVSAESFTHAAGALSADELKMYMEVLEVKVDTSVPI